MVQQYDELIIGEQTLFHLPTVQVIIKELFNDHIFMNVKSQPTRVANSLNREDIFTETTDCYLYNFVRPKTKRSGSQNIRIQPRQEKSSCESFEQVFHRRNLSLKAQQSLKDAFETKMKKQLLLQRTLKLFNPAEVSRTLKLRRTVPKQMKSETNEQKQHQLTHQTSGMTQNTDNSSAALTSNVSVPVKLTKCQDSSFDLSVRQCTPLRQVNARPSSVKPPNLRQQNPLIPRGNLPLPYPKKFPDKENRTQTSEPLRKQIRIQTRIGTSVQVQRNHIIQNYVNEMNGRISSIGVLENDCSPWKSDDDFDRTFHYKRLR